MTVAPKPPPQRRGVRARLLHAAMMAAGLGGWAAACSSIESMSFSDGTCVGSGCEQTTAAGAGSSSSGTCTVNAACAVSWKNDIFAGMLDVPAPGGANCTGAAPCHGASGGAGGLTLTPGMADAAYAAITALTLSATPSKPYVVPCDDAGTHSGMLCNMATDANVGMNPFGSCGSLMPLSGSANLTPAQIKKIATWIACGAPNN